jgi:hypothetical protein
VNNTFYLKKYRATDSFNKCLLSLPVGSLIALTHTTPLNAHTRDGSDKGYLSDKIRALCNNNNDNNNIYLTAVGLSPGGSGF